MGRVLPTGTVTMLFTDVEGSTRLLDAVGDDYGRLLAAHHALLRSVWTQFGGVEVDTAGDAFFVAFPVALDAVGASIEAERRLATHHWPGDQQVRVRIGIHTGAPRVHEGMYWGSDVHYAARLSAAAHGGQVLISETTRVLVPGIDVESVGAHALKDFPAPRELFHVIIDGSSAQGFAAPRTASPRPPTLPVRRESLVGRDTELLAIVEQIPTSQLTSLVGAGGVGKTRLMTELGHEIASWFDEVHFVALEQLTDPDDVAATIGRALRLPGSGEADDAARVCEYLARRSVLLLLDNVEQVVAARSVIARIAASDPDVRVVVTGQTPLHVTGEHVIRIGMLPLPGGHESGTAELGAVPSVALLRNRARVIGASFELSTANASDVVRLCQQLEGLPLALELAAARLDLLGPGGLADRLEKGKDALGQGDHDLPARQRGLRAMLEWTCDLLSDEARDLLAKLSAFAGGATVDLAEDAFGDCVDELQELLDVSLLRGSASTRLVARPPVRRFASDLLARGGDQAVDGAFAGMTDALTRLASPFAKRWFAVVGEGRLVVGPEANNIVAALNWSRDRDPRRHARLAAATGWWMTHANLTQFGREHLDAALRTLDDPQTEAQCLQALGTLGLAAADPSASLRAAQAWHAIGDVEGEVVSLCYAANLLCHRGEASEALRVADTAADVAAGGPPTPELSWLIDTMRAQAFGQLGRETDAELMLSAYLVDGEIASWQSAVTASTLADLALSGGRSQRALELYGAAMIALRKFDTQLVELMQADTVALALARLERRDEAETCLAICEFAHAEMMWPPRGSLATALQTTREILGHPAQPAARRLARDLGTADGLSWVAAGAQREV